MTWTCTPWAHARAFLFVPADRPDRLRKACDSQADVLIFDLEDAVAPEMKAQARENLSALVAGAHAAGLAAIVRVNHDVLQLADDLRALVKAHADGFIWPKAENSGMLEAIDQALQALGAPDDLAAIALVEHPCMMDHERLMALAKAPRVQALALGSEDFSAAMGVAPTPELLQGPAQAVIRAARACGRSAIALPCSIATLDDMQAWQQALHWARAQGAQGCLCIHPRQIELVTATLKPSAQELAWAQRVLDMAQHHQGSAFRLDGLMIDVPVLQRARHWLASAQNTSIKTTPHSH